jgi:hypothetical protein
MASGTIYGSTGNQYIDSKIEWSSVTNNSANTSTVTASLYYKRNNTGFETKGTGGFSVTIDGQSQSASATMTITGSAWVLAMTATKTVSHNGDGTKTITISASGSISGTTLSSTSCSGRVSLTTIPRASTITSAINKTLDTACEVKWTPLAKAFRYKLKFSLGEWSYTTGAIHPNTTAAYIYTGYKLPLAVANQLPKAKTGTMTVALYTYSDSGATTQIGSASSKTFTVTVPNNSSTKPTVTMSLAPVDSLGDAFSALYIQGKSKVKATLSASGKYGATITSYKMYIGGKEYGSPYQSGYLSTPGTVTITGRAYDSRGYYNDIKTDITVIPYSKPQIKNVTASRCDSSGNLTDSGTHLKIEAKRSYSPVVSGGVQKNFCAIRYRYKTAEASSYSAWTTILASSSLDSDEIVTGALLNGALLTTKTYVVQVGVVDTIGGYANTTDTIPTDKVYMHRDGSRNALAIGKYVEKDNCVDIADDWDVCGRVYSLGKGKANIPNGSDLNDYKGFGVYNITSNSIAASLSNCPHQKAGVLIVSSSTGDAKQNGTWAYILQRYRSFDGKYEYYRLIYTGATADEWIYNKWECRSSPYWVDLGLSSNVATSTYKMGRSPFGCSYRVVDENHIYVAFNCSFTWSGENIIVNNNQIPEGYRPARNIYAFCAVGGKYIARAIVTTAGNLVIEWVQNLLSAEETTSRTVSWIDGYIDYWV